MGRRVLPKGNQTPGKSLLWMSHWRVGRMIGRFGRAAGGLWLGQESPGLESLAGVGGGASAGDGGVDGAFERGSRGVGKIRKTSAAARRK